MQKGKDFDPYIRRAEVSALELLRAGERRQAVAIGQQQAQDTAERERQDAKRAAFRKLDIFGAIVALAAHQNGIPHDARIGRVRQRDYGWVAATFGYATEGGEGYSYSSSYQSFATILGPTGNVYEVALGLGAGRTPSEMVADATGWFTKPFELVYPMSDRHLEYHMQSLGNFVVAHDLQEAVHQA